MKEQLTSLKENIETHILQLKGRLYSLSQEEKEVTNKISYMEGRIFEIKEVLQYLENAENRQPGVANGNQSNGQDNSKSESSKENF